VDSTYYQLTHFRAEINTKHELTEFDHIKPSSTHAVDSETKVIERNKQTLAAILSTTLGVSGLKPTALFSLSGSKTKESSLSREVKIFNSRIIQEDRDGAVWWDFIVDDPYQQERGSELHDSLPCVSSTFLESSDDALPPSAPDLFGIKITSCWSLIPCNSNPLSLLTAWLPSTSSEMMAPTPYSNLCQTILLDLPSQLPKDSHYKAVAKVTPSSWMALDVKRDSIYQFTPVINFSNSPEV